MSEKYNIKSLVAASGLNYRAFKKELSIMLSDTDIKIKFGDYKYKMFTRRQVQLCIDNIPYLEHMKSDFYQSNPDLTPSEI